MFLKSFKIIVCILAVALCLSGCMTHENLSDLTIVQGVGIDEDRGETKVSLQYLNLAKSGGVSEALQGNITYVASGKSVNISDAVATASKSLSKSIFFGQNKVLVFGGEYAKKHLSMGMDYLLRSVNSRPDVLVAMSEKKASEIIENKERGARIPAQNVYDLLIVGESNGLGASVTVNDLLNLYSDETSDVYMPVLSANEESVSCKGIGIFSKEQYVYTMNAFETFGFLFVNNNIKGGLITVSNENLGKVGVEIIKASVKNRADVKDGRITFCCDVKVEVVLDEVEKGVTISVDRQRIEAIEHLVSQKIETMCRSAIRVCFKHKSDPFMFGRYVSKADSKFYDSIKSNWRNTLPEIQIAVNAAAVLEKVNDNSSLG